MECMDDVIRRMETKLANERNERALDAFFHEHGAAIVHDWYRKITKATNRTTRMACEDYSHDLLREYKKCFQEFPHEHPKAFIQALHEEILPQVTVSTEMEGSAVESLLKGVTDKGLVAVFATSRKRVATGRKCLSSTP
ncbi:uncharacterized protein LOC105442436 [Strongylocentrotus purpuratus]|uniref:Uncharacterized protein n=1 Tax=Strongylocentrotus purpuratus TaxID=7668 RepID=A0A7M7N2Z2_STRPU|nr:uncharacterized protein LOC105442436 [Strongylocentrotus purpuratus]